MARKGCSIVTSLMHSPKGCHPSIPVEGPMHSSLPSLLSVPSRKYLHMMKPIHLDLRRCSSVRYYSEYPPSSRLDLKRLDSLIMRTYFRDGTLVRPVILRNSGSVYNGSKSGSFVARAASVLSASTAVRSSENASTARPAFDR
jgi:hypothetical protein